MNPEKQTDHKELDEQFKDMEEDSLSNLSSEQSSVREMCNPPIEIVPESISKYEEEDTM